jgi:hypothetical protein
MPRVNPPRRGNWLVAASGQRLRHNPGATKNTSGSSGTARPQSTVWPSDGCSQSSHASASAAAIEEKRSACHIHSGSSGSSCV